MPEIEDDFDLYGEEELERDSGKRKSKDKPSGSGFAKDEIIFEKDHPKGYDKAVLYNKKGDKEDRVLKTTIWISPYAKNLVDGLKDENRTTFSLSMLEIVSSVIDSFDALLNNRYEQIVNIRKFINNANMSDTEIDLSLPCVEVYGGGKKKINAHAMILSSSQTIIKKHGESFMISDSDISEMLIYMYFAKQESRVSSEIRRGLECKDKVGIFLSKVDAIIEEQTALRDIDTTRAFMKIWISGANKSIQKREMPDGSEFRVTFEKVYSQKGDGHNEKSRKNGIFVHKNGRKARPV